MILSELMCMSILACNFTKLERKHLLHVKIINYTNQIYNIGIYKHVRTYTTGQLITQPPESMTAALGTNATFSCRGDGYIIWEISGTQVQTKQLVQLFALEKVYVHLHAPSVSRLIMTATEMNNFTRTIQCLVDPGIGAGPVEVSSAVHLLVYGEYKYSIARTCLGRYCSLTCHDYYRRC